MVRGIRFLKPEEKLAKNKIVEIIKKKFELYGYLPLETPVIEEYSFLASKYAGGSEILKETYRLKDRGGRDLALRYDLTVMFARFIKENPNIKLPFKRYEIGPVFRDGPVKAGRFREFWQADADVIGIKDVIAEAEILAMAKDIFNELNIDVKIFVNDISLLRQIVRSYISKEAVDEIILSIDKLRKIGKENVIKEIVEKGIDKEKAKKLVDFIVMSGSNEEKLERLKEFNVENIKKLIEYCKSFDIDFIFDPSLARGLSYYTGIIFEIYTEGFSSSIAAGGRYDKMMKLLAGLNDDLPAVGISFGIDVLVELLKEKFAKESLVDVFIIPIKQESYAIKILNKLRKANIKADIDFLGRSISKNLDFVNKRKIPYAIIIGEDEVRQGKIKLKEMSTGKERLISIEECIDFLKDKDRNI